MTGAVFRFAVLWSLAAPVCGSLFGDMPSVSKTAPRYFALQNGKGWVPIGLNICFSRMNIGCPGDEGMKVRRREFEGWLRAFAAVGGNYARFWLGHEFFEVMPERPGEFDGERTETLMRMVRLCEELGIRLKFTLESFRTVRPRGLEGDAQYATFFNRSLYSPYANDMHEFLHDDKCFGIYLGKVKYLASLGLGDSPAVMAWEPWNEINCIGPWNGDVGPWSDRMLREIRRIFPKQMTTQSLGSFSGPGIYDYYDYLAGMERNDFLQIHRYLDCGAEQDVCHGPMDVLAADAIRELLDRNGGKPAVLAEVGAVKPNHTGPSVLYEQDREGTLLHDALFAPFFSGSAGCGQFWHWDSYVARWGLWWHYARFGKAIEGVDPVAEDFRPFHTETRRLRLYGLRGRRNTLVWCRDKASSWRSELVDGNPAAKIEGERHPFGDRNLSCYLPWEDRTVEVSGAELPSFRRSLVVRFATFQRSNNQKEVCK